MKVLSLTHYTRGVSGRQEVHIHYTLGFLDRLLRRPAHVVLAHGPEGWRTSAGKALSLDQMFLLSDALEQAKQGVE